MAILPVSTINLYGGPQPNHDNVKLDGTMPGRWDMRAQSPNPALRELLRLPSYGWDLLNDESDAYAQTFVPGHHGYETGESHGWPFRADLLSSVYGEDYPEVYVH